MGALAEAVDQLLVERWGGVVGLGAVEHFGMSALKTERWADNPRTAQQILKNWLGKGSDKTRSIPSGRAPLLIRGLPADRQREVARAELRERLGGISEAYLTVLRLWTADDSVVRLVSAALRCERDEARDWLTLAA